MGAIAMHLDQAQPEGRSMTGDAIVFVHGGLGLGMALHRGRRRAFAARLARAGIAFIVPPAPGREGIAGRAAALAIDLARIDADRLHLVGYSMGGLVARRIASAHDPDRRIRTVVTVATPHRGSPLARWLLDGDGGFAWLMRRVWGRTLVDLTPESCARFNRTTPDRSDVTYLSYAAVSPEGTLPRWMAPLGRRLAASSGDNDGVVPTESARWGRECELLRADHLQVIGLGRSLGFAREARTFDAFAFFERLAIALAGTPRR